MQLITDGLVLREVKVKEADRIITLLTREKGVVSAVAKGSLRLKNKLASSTGLLCYSEFQLFSGVGMYKVDDAAPKNVFFELRSSVDALALAMYMAELTAALAPEESPAGEYLDFLLNAFTFLCKKSSNLKLVKAAFELRLMAMAGFMPDLVACEVCGKFEEKLFYFDIDSGYIICSECTGKAGKAPNVNLAVLSAMRHILFSSEDKIYNFTLGAASADILYQICGAFCAHHLDKPLKTRAFLQEALG